MGKTRVFPSPTLILGLGRFGLGLLERLGEDWQGLSFSGSDESLDNLRLVWLHADAQDEIGPWSALERSTVQVARHVENSDLPSLALEFVILRSLGLIRYRSGQFEVAILRDSGLVDRNRGAARSRPDEAETEGQGSSLVRCRYFEWLPLTPDPVTSAESLKRKTEADPELDLFVNPIINRVRQGHSPQTLLACIARCRALVDGRDPSPWPWVRKGLEIHENGKPHAPVAQDAESGQVDCESANSSAVLGGAWVSAQLKPEDGLLEYAPEPFEGWRAWLQSARSAWGEEFRRQHLVDDDEGSQAATRSEDFEQRAVWSREFLAWLRSQPDSLPAETLEVRIPPPFRPVDGDLGSPLDPKSLLWVNQKVTGWATEDPNRVIAGYPQADVSPLRLGLFDHQKTPASAERCRKLSRRLERLGRYVHQGLVRLWVDLQRERVEEAGPIPGVRRIGARDESLRQSLEILRGLVVEPVARFTSDGVGAADSSDGASASAADFLPTEIYEMPKKPSALLENLESRRRRRRAGVESVLERRLADLGLETGTSRESRGRLLRKLQLEAPDVPPDGDPCIAGDAREAVDELAAQHKKQGGQPASKSELEGSGDWSEDLPSLCRILNEEVRSLFDVQFLAGYRGDIPTRKPPRLTVFVVGDLSEPFTRICFRPVLRAIHAELLRSFGPIFEMNLEGFDRALSVVPILWMPHPADPKEGASRRRVQEEESAIIEAVHGVRRWVESVLPSARRRVSQIFVNGRVTDTAILSVRDSIRQTRDFINFLSRNDVGREDWLRRAATGPGGSDLFASFACYEIDFPAERAREFLANRLARDCLESLRSEPRRGSHRDESSREDATASETSSAKASPKAVGSDGASGAGPPDGLKILGRDRSSVLVKACESIADETQAVGESAKSKVLTGAGPDDQPVQPGDRARKLRERYDDEFQRGIERTIGEAWLRLISRRGEMDQRVDQLRQETSRQIADTLETIRIFDDAQIEKAAGEAGLMRSLATLDELRIQSHDQLLKSESERRDKERISVRHSIPATHPIRHGRQRILEAVEDKPDQEHLELGWALVALMAPVLGAPLLHTFSLLFHFPERGSPIDFWDRAAGPWAPALGMLVVLAIAGFGYFWHLKKKTERVNRAVRDLGDTVYRIAAGSRDGSGDQISTEVRIGESASLRSFFVSRLGLTEALADRQFAAKVYQQVMMDYELANRIRRSLDIQLYLLRHRAELLGVRPKMDSDEEDVASLFHTHSREGEEKLIPPEALQRYYSTRIREHDRTPTTRLLLHTGGLNDWRRTASLSSTDAIMDFTRGEFDHILRESITEQEFFAHEVGDRLVRFVQRNYSNMGFGAKFKGYEGLDPDGVHVLADAALVLGPSLRRIFEEARGPESKLAYDIWHASRHEAQSSKERRRDEGRRRSAYIKTLDVLEHAIRANAAYMLSLVQGVRAHSVHNLKRFESFFDRSEGGPELLAEMPKTHEPEREGALDFVFERRDWADELYRSVRRLSSGDSEETSEP